MNSNIIDTFLEDLFYECPFDSNNQRTIAHERATESADSFCVEIELAGVKKEDITLDVEGDYITVTATKKVPSIEETKILFDNRKSGKFKKSYKLGSNIDKDTIEAEFTNGVLVVTLNKKETQKKKTVKIS
jgi:HSP20 family protein